MSGSLVRLLRTVGVAMLVLGVYATDTTATIEVRGRVVDLSCRRGRYLCRVELTNGNNFAQHPSIYVKLIKVGLYEDECVEFVEYIPELPPESTELYLIPLETRCNVVVKPYFKIRLKRMKSSSWEEQIMVWGEGCPRKRVERAN
jgi:hypothetical protein